MISIGHSHPHYIEALKNQLDNISFYSNSVQNTMQEALAEKLGRISGYPDYQLFLCNSGAEANENALKLASFVTGRKKVIAFKKSFHGRTSGAVATTDNPKIVAPFNAGHEIEFLPLNDEEALNKAINSEIAAVIVEGIQGVGGIQLPNDSFFQLLSEKCKEAGALLILDEVQSGYGRTGKFFAHQFSQIKPDLITTAKGMGNGFPVGGVLIAPAIKPWSGMLGTTFGGNYLACAASIAVLDIIEQEELAKNAESLGNYLIEKLKEFSPITQVRGRGLIIGFDLTESFSGLRKDLLFKHKIFTGEAKPNTVRLLPSLALKKEEADILLHALSIEINQLA